MRRYFIISLLLLFFSCEYFGLQEKSKSTEEPIATVFSQKLYKNDIKDLLPKNINKNDSLVLVRSIINDWAIKQLMLRKAEENNSTSDNSKVNKLVQDYRQALLINGYKEKLIKQQLDTLISELEIQDYYKNNGQNFRLNEELIQTRYIHFSSDLLDKREVVKLFKEGEIESLEELEQRQLSFKSMMLNDSIWTPVENVLLKTPFSRENLLKKTKFLEKEDSLGVYLVAVNDVLKRNDIAPLSYIEPTIKQMILHQRKLQLIRDIEKIILKDAVQNKSYTIN